MPKDANWRSNKVVTDSLVKWCTGLGNKRFDVRCIMFGVKLSY